MTHTPGEKPDEQPSNSANPAATEGDSVLSEESSTADADPYSPSSTAAGTDDGSASGASPSPGEQSSGTFGPGGQADYGQAQGYQASQQAGYQQGGYQQIGYQQGGYQQAPQGYPPPAQGGYQQPAAYDPQAGQYSPQPGQYAPPPPAYPNQPGYPPQQYAGPQPMSQSDERLWATLSHISIPFIGVIGPLIVYLVFKDRSAFVKDQGAESLNFSILYTIVQIAAGILSVVVIGLIVLPLAFIAVLILCIMAAIAANKGELYRYPVNWRLIK